MKTRNSLLLFIASIIWGMAFVSQSTGGDAVGPWSFNTVRSLIAAVALLPVSMLLDRLHLSHPPKTAEDKQTLLRGGILCGVFLFLASNAQQLGISMGSEIGKAGFLTAFYILLVPILGLFLHRKCDWNIWLGVAIAMIGLYLLCFNGKTRLQASDLLCILGAFFFSLQITMIAHYSPLCDGVRLSCIEFATTGLLGILPSFWLEMHHSLAGIAAWACAFQSADAWIAILYAGILSSGVAYTLQIIGQNGLNPTIASLIMSLESVFSVIAGAVFLNQYLTARETIGCIVLFTAILIAQLPLSRTRTL